MQVVRAEFSVQGAAQADKCTRYDLTAACEGPTSAACVPVDTLQHQVGPEMWWQ